VNSGLDNLFNTMRRIYFLGTTKFWETAPECPSVATGLFAQSEFLMPSRKFLHLFKPRTGAQFRTNADAVAATSRWRCPFVMTSMLRHFSIHKTFHHVILHLKKLCEHPPFMKCSATERDILMEFLHSKIVR